MRRIIAYGFMGAAFYLSLCSAVWAQVAIGGGGAGGALGDSVVNYFYTNFIHGIAAAGVLALLIGALFLRSHLGYFAVAIIALLCIGNYQAILGLFNLG
jgi:hypothetical protein